MLADTNLWLELARYCCSHHVERFGVVSLEISPINEFWQTHSELFHIVSWLELWLICDSSVNLSTVKTQWTQYFPLRSSFRQLLLSAWCSWFDFVNVCQAFVWKSLVSLTCCRTVAEAKVLFTLEIATQPSWEVEFYDWALWILPCLPYIPAAYLGELKFSYSKQSISHRALQSTESLRGLFWLQPSHNLIWISTTSTAITLKFYQGFFIFFFLIKVHWTVLPQCLHGKQCSVSSFAEPDEHCFHDKDVSINSEMYCMSLTLPEIQLRWNLLREWHSSNPCFERLPAPTTLANHTCFCKMLKANILMSFYFIGYSLCSYVFLSEQWFLPTYLRKCRPYIFPF